MKRFFTSDQHFWHQNILRYCNRPFSNIKEMNNKLIIRYNSLVSEDDKCYFIGDFSMVKSNEHRRLQPILDKLKGRKILILGNHDDCKVWNYINIGFESVHTSLELDNGWILNHDPAPSCIIRNRIWIVGHVHDLFIKQKNCINVGVDVWDYKPVSEDDIKRMLNVSN